MKYKYKVYILVLFALLFRMDAKGQSLFNVQNGAVVSFAENSLIRINGDITIESGGTLNIGQNAIIELIGSWINEGTQNCDIGAKVYFVGDAETVVISGNGTAYQFKSIIIEKDAKSYLVQLDAPISVPNGFLTLTRGTFEIAGPHSLTNTVFDVYEINENSGFILNNGNATINGQNADFILSGSLDIKNGTFNVGTASNPNNLLYQAGTTAPTLSISGGELNINSRLSRSGDNDSIRYTQSGGEVYIGKAAVSSELDRGMFDISQNSTFNVSGGTIEMQRPSTSSDDYLVQAESHSVSGGLLKFNAQDPSNNTFTINSTVPIGALTILGNNNPVVSLAANFLVLGDIAMNGSGSNRFNIYNHNLSLGGDWINNFTATSSFSQSTGAVIFVDDKEQKIRGTLPTVFQNISINKTGGKVEQEHSTTINGNLRLLSNTSIFDIKAHDLVIGVNAKIYPDNGSDEKISLFSSTKCIINSSTEILTAPTLIKMLPPTLNVNNDITYHFPLSTPSVYTPNSINIYKNGASFGSNAYIAIKCLPYEHPAAEVSNHSLQKYWAIETNNVTIHQNGATVDFYYAASEVRGNEGNWRILYFAPSWDDPNGFWKMDPGRAGDIVEFNQKMFYSVQVSAIVGDWTAGEPDVAFAQYYARQDGDYNDPETWSKQGFNGDASNTAPNKRSDRVRIQDHTVTVTEDTPPAQIISIENGTEERKPGKLRIEGEHLVIGDTLKLDQNATLSIGSEKGIAQVPVEEGNVRTNIRAFSSGAIYEYFGSGLQTLGDGLPSTIKSLIVSKPANETLRLSQNISITDSLVINNGILDMASATINGNSSGRTFTMLDGELIVRSAFPNNYTAPYLTAGRITFDGAGSVTIPSSGSSPGILQYNDLKICGDNRAGNVTLQSLGEIKIKNLLDISELNFADNTYKFFTNGSTVRFNKNGGAQDVPCKPAFPSDTVCFLEYYNLTLDSAGTKQLSASGNPVFKVTNNLKIESGADFTAYNSDLDENYNLEIQGNWLNEDGTFNPGEGTVIFNSPVATLSTLINSRDTTANPFHNLIFAGDGIVKSNDNLKVEGNLTISNETTFNLTDKFLSIYGNWHNDDGLFEYGTSTVQFNSKTRQNITRTVGNIQFYNLNINNPESVDASGISAAGNGMIINKDLNLNAGNLITHIDANYRFATVLGEITRAGEGYIDGELRRNIPADAYSYTFPVGYLDVYSPVTVEFTGTGGAAGLISVLSDTVTTSTAPISWADATPTNILPSGSTIDPQKHITRQFTIKMPSGSSFLLGVNRKFNTIFSFQDDDLRNGTNKDLLDFRTYNNNDLWIAPYNYGSFPFIQTRTDNSITINQNVDFGTFILGEPGTLIFYTRASGEWNCRTCWSAQGYGLNSADSYPGDGGNNNYQAFIGDGNTITLNSNISVTGANGHIQVDSSGVLMCENYTISGNGTFNLGKDATLGIGNVNGIMQTGSFGNIQTSVRNFNLGDHNRGRFIYTSSSNQTQANNGLPETVALLQLRKGSSTLTMNRANLTIQDSLYIQSGTLSQGNSTSLTVNGNWVNYGTYTHNNRTVTFSGSKNDTIKAGLTQNFNNLIIQKSGGNLHTEQALNIASALTFGSGNQAVLIAQEPNTYVDVVGASLTRTGSGHVYGELRKNVPRNAANPTIVTWEVGSDSIHGYRPFELTLTGNNQGTAGALAVRLFDGIQPNYDSRPASNAVDPAWLVYKYWRLTIPSGSSFSLGTREANVALQFINPDDLRNGAVPGCFDINLWDGSNWKLFNKIDDKANHGSSYCGDRPIGSHTYSGSDTTVKVTSNMSGSLGTGTLIGDFITGRAVAIPTTTYFSINSGNWSDPNNWSTQGYNGEPAETFPCRFFDIAYIGNGKHITLDMCIGHGDFTSIQTYEGREFYALRTINVVDNSKLSLGTNYIYCFGINVSNSSTIEVGSLGGIVNYTGSNITTGNIRIASGGYTHFDDTDDNHFIYTAEGETSNFGLFALSGGTPPAGSNSSAWIEKVELQGENNTAINNTSGRNTIPRSGYAFFPYEQATLEAGKSYTIKLTPGGSSSKWKGWIDYDFNGSFDNTNEVAFVQTSASFSERSLTIDVPPDAKPGTTRMRITMWTGSGTPGPTSNPPSSGEVEDYSIKIVNPNYGKLTQSIGSGLPNKFASLTVNTNRAGDDVTLGKTVNIDEYLKISNGTLNAGSNNINIYGDFIQEVANGFNSQTSNVIFTGSKANHIEADDPIGFYRFRINKDGNEKVNCDADININNLFAFETDNNLVLNKENTITLEQSCNLTGDFSQNRMIEVDGASEENNIVKKFPPLTPPSDPSDYCNCYLRSSGRYIDRVQIAGTSLNNGSGQSGYTNFTTTVPAPTLTAGVNYTLSATKDDGSGWLASSRNWRLWIDYNQDGTFDNELVSSSNNAKSYSYQLTIPITAYNGFTRLRLKMSDDSNTNSCEESNNDGEYEDYLIYITGATDKPTVSADFLFPLGTDGQYHPADLAFTVGANSTPTISLGLRNQKHDAKLTDNSLDRYWSFSSTGFNGITAINKLQLRYYNSNISGDIQKYIPGRYRKEGESGSWEINLGDNPLAKLPVVADSLLITIEKDSSGIFGDYTAGEPLVYFPGRVFYSINTGEWNNKFNWSNDPDLKHGGKAASYFPGMIFEDDTVNIDGHIITFKDSLNITVDSLQIGGTNSFNARGQLIFGSLPLAKSLTLRQLALYEDGLITGESPGGRQDTIKIKENVKNETGTHQGRTGGITLRNDASNSTTLKFIGNDDSQIQGNGNWGEIGDIVLSKAGGLSNTLSISSESYYEAVNAATNFKFHFWSGVFLNNLNKDFKLSTTDEMIEMEPNSGIASSAGKILSKAGLTTNMNTIINLDGGDLEIGSGENHHLLYKTGTSITVKEGKLNIAGGLSRALDNSIVNFSLGDGVVKVNTKRNTEKIGFDLSNAGSSFSMTGGRIIIANQSGTTPLQFDYRVNAQGGIGMEGGVLQCGDASTPDEATIKIGGNLPVYSLHFANDPANEVTTEITEEVFNVKGNWEIDYNHSFSLKGNTVNLGGDLRNFGSFSAVPVTASASPWQITLNGANDQILLSDLAPLELYNLRIDKPADTRVILSDDGNSNLVLRNTLEFSTNNLAYISAPVEKGRYVEISPIPDVSQPQILRNGKGHISGRLYMHIGEGIQNVFFPVGGDGINIYRPATVSTIDMDNTAGLLGIINYDSDHPDIENSKLDSSSNIQSYWNVKPKDSGGFALAVDKEFSLKLQFLNPDDIRDNVSPLFLEQRLYSPPCPDPPTVCDGSGTWYEVLTPSRSDTSSGSVRNKEFGDFAIGFPSGVTFYSWKDGDWLSSDTWSLDGYEGAQNKPDRFPDEQYDIVRIGNGKKVTVPKQKSPEVRSVFVEMYNGKPGFLQIEGQTNFIAGASFSLGNDCTIGLEHINGIAPEHETSRGAVLTNIRNYGVSRYLFNSKDGAQATVLPENIKTVIVNNVSTPYNALFINNENTIKILDSIIVENGEFQASKSMFLYGTLLIQSNNFNNTVVNPRFSPLDGIFTFAGDQDKYIILANRVGVTFHNLNIAGGTVYAIDSVSAENDSSNVKVKSTMNFTGDAIFSLEDGARPLNLIIENSAAGSITGFSSNRFIRTSPSSGYLKRKVAPELRYNFPVGSLNLDGTANLFAPMTFEAGASGEAGWISARTSKGAKVNGAHLMISSNPEAKFLKRYWTIDSVSAKINGKWSFTYNDADLVNLSDGDDLTKIGRWRPVKEQSPGSWAHPFVLENINRETNTIYTDDAFSWEEFTGDWLIGNIYAFRRIFYSRQTGLWNDPNTWTFIASPPHEGVEVEAGLWPNSEQDSVVIGGKAGVNHIVTLNIPEANVDGVALGELHAGTLAFQGENALTGKHFNMFDYSTLKISSKDGINSIGNIGNIRSTDMRTFSENGIYEYIGQDNQTAGDALPNTVYGLIINNSGGEVNNLVSLNKNIQIKDNLSILKGVFNLQTDEASGLANAVFSISENARLRITGTKDLLTSLNGYNSYIFDENSYTEFFGTNQTISNFPTNLSRNIGLGNVIVSESGEKKVSDTFKVRGSIWINNNSTLFIDEPKLLQVHKNIINSSIINNSGIIEIGNCD